MKKIRVFVVRYWEILSYLFFGGMTTLVNYCVYLPLYNLCHVSGTVSNIAAWIVSVAFAFLTNKPFVFRSHDWSLSTVLPELGKFVGCRLGSGVMETAIIFVTVDLLRWNGNWVKLVVSVLVVIANYAASKWLVFREKQ